MLRSIALFTLGGLTLLSLGLRSDHAAHQVPARPLTIASDQAGPSDQQLMRRADSEQRRVVTAQLLAAQAKALLPPSIEDIIRSAFQPLGESAVGWALQIAFCESTNNPAAVNSITDAQGLFQFLPTTWAGTPYAGQSPFDAVANARAAAWLLQTYGAGQWECRA